MLSWKHMIAVHENSIFKREKKQRWRACVIDNRCKINAAFQRKIDNVCFKCLRQQMMMWRSIWPRSSQEDWTYIFRLHTNLRIGSHRDSKGQCTCLWRSHWSKIWGQFTRQNYWVRTRQEKSTDLTFFQVSGPNFLSCKRAFVDEQLRFEPTAAGVELSNGSRLRGTSLNSSGAKTLQVKL